MTSEGRGWPACGQRVEVHLAGPVAALVAVVDDVRPPDQLHLREPVQPDGASVPCPPVGTPLRLEWTGSRGVHVLDVLLTGLPQSRVRLWQLRPVREVDVLQRREFIRVHDVLPVELHQGEQSWRAGLCDLSESGARCVLPAELRLSAGDAVQVALDLQGVPLRLEAGVVAVEPLDAQRVTVRLRFGELGRQADLIRRRVLDVQRRARALERR